MTISRRTLSLTLSLALSAAALTAMAQTLPMPKVSGTLRTKMEVQTERSESRFEVRNARVALDGKITDAIGYKAEIDPDQNVAASSTVEVVIKKVGVPVMRHVNVRIGFAKSV